MIDSHKLALVIGIFLTALSQVLLRSGAQKKPTWLSSFLNVRTVLGYGLFVFVTALNVHALQTIPLRTVTAWISTTYILTPFMAKWLLKEELNASIMAGSVLILVGIVVFSFGDIGLDRMVDDTRASEDSQISLANVRVHLPQQSVSATAYRGPARTATGIEVYSTR